MADTLTGDIGSDRAAFATYQLSRFQGCPRVRPCKLYNNKD